MFVCNLKINRKSISRVIKIMLALIFVMGLLFFGYKNRYKIKRINTKNLELNSSTYTNFLKDCHENIDKYVGCNVKITGYVYRMPDFTNNQFVIARTMLFDSDTKAVVVGILCESDSAGNYKDYDWVTIEGIVGKGNYKGEMPIVKVQNITKANVPEDEFVHLPSD